MAIDFGIKMIFEGLLVNIIITTLSCIVPIVVGILSNKICKQNQALTQPARLCGLFFESLCPILAIVVFYFLINLGPMIACVLGLTLSFIGYMPSHFNEEHSFAKNTIVNAIGLISIVFKWTLCVSFIGVHDIFGITRMYCSQTYEMTGYLISLIIVFAIIFILELAKFVAREKM